jgi:hypothetical protein
MIAAPPPVSGRGRINACELIRNLPLRWREGDSDRETEEILESGWFFGAQECARVLSAMMKTEQSCGRAFATEWPILASESTIVAPAIPVAVPAEGAPVAGADGEYRWAEDGIHREAVGVEHRVVAMNETEPSGGGPFDLLWFGDTERFILGSGTLEIEDLFAACRVPASTTLLENLLIRSRRLDPALVDGLLLDGATGAPEIEVRRPAVLSTDERWRDACGFLANRVDIVDAQRNGSAITVQTAAGATEHFEVNESADGWHLQRTSEKYPLRSVAVIRDATTLCLRATLAPEINPLAPGMRERLAFDLRSDLVALG